MLKELSVGISKVKSKIRLLKIVSQRYRKTLGIGLVLPSSGIQDETASQLVWEVVEFEFIGLLGI